MVLLGQWFEQILGLRSWTLTTRNPDSKPWPKSPGRLDSIFYPNMCPLPALPVIQTCRHTHEPRLCCHGCCVCCCGGCSGCCCCCCCLLLFVVVVVVVVVVFVVVLALRTRQVFVPLPPPRPRRLPGATIMMTLPALEPTERAFGTNQTVVKKEPKKDIGMFLGGKFTGKHMKMDQQLEGHVLF